MSKEEGSWVWLLALAMFSIFEILHFLWISYNIKSRLHTLTNIFHKFCPPLQPHPLAYPQETWVRIVMDQLQFHTSAFCPVPLGLRDVGGSHEKKAFSGTCKGGRGLVVKFICVEIKGCP